MSLVDKEEQQKEKIHFARESEKKALHRGISGGKCEDPVTVE